MKSHSGTHHESLHKQVGMLLQETINSLSADGKEAARIQRNWEMESKKNKDSLLLSTASDGVQTVQTGKSGVMALH